MHFIGKSTLSRIFKETCGAIFESLSGEYLDPHSSRKEWENIAHDFQKTWNLPHVVGAIDDKYITIQCPKQSGTLFHYYKGFFSFVFLAICDACYYFTLFDVGQYGRNNPVGIYLLKVSNRNTRTRCEMCSKLTIKTPEQRQWRPSGVFIINFEYVSHLALVFLLLTLNM